MPTFMDVHEGFVGASAEDFQKAHQADLATMRVTGQNQIGLALW